MTQLVADSLVMAERNLVRLPRSPDLLIGFTIQPVMFVLLFAYVFGGAIVTPGYDYVDFLIPGHHRPEHRVRRLRDRPRPRRGPHEGPDRPVPLAADRPRLGAGRPRRWPTS